MAPEGLAMEGCAFYVLARGGRKLTFDSLGFPALQ